MRNGLLWSKWRGWPKRSGLLKMLREADCARDERDWTTAAARYAQVLAQDGNANSRRAPVMTRTRRAAICIQLGHVLREQGILDRAEAPYRESVALYGVLPSRTYCLVWCSNHNCVFNAMVECAARQPTTCRKGRRIPIRQEPA